MSMTKRYLESLPADKQNTILGGIDNAYISPDEWTNDAENEPTFEDRVNQALHDWIEQGNPDAPIDWPEENEPLEQCAICGCGFSSVFEGTVCPDCVATEANEGDGEWARALIEEDDEELNDPLVKCRICRASRPISEMNANGECPPCVRETALMVKPTGKCVRLEDHNGIEWRL